MTDYDGDFDEDFHICDDSMAEEFVNDAWAHMSEKDIVYLRYVYLRRFVKKDLDSSQKIIDAMYDMKGGANKIDDISDPILRMFLRFMELVDSVHDYDSERQVQLLMQVLHITETDFPWVLVENGKGVVSKVQLTIADVLSYDDLMTKLTCTTSIYFGDLQMESPFWKLDYRPLVFYPPKHPVTVEEMFSRLHDHRSSLNPVAPVQIPQFDEKYTAQQYIAIIRRFMAKPVDTKRQDVNMRSHFECTEVIARKEEPFTIVQKIQQIADTCDTMRHKFGGDACFMADANQPLAKFLLSYSNLQIKWDTFFLHDLGLKDCAPIVIKRRAAREFFFSWRCVPIECAVPVELTP